MENSNRNDVVRFFEDMPIEMQQEVIDKLNKQIKKPPDSDESESEVIQISELSVK